MLVQTLNSLCIKQEIQHNKMALKAKAEITRLVSSWGGWQALLSSLASVTAIGWLINKLLCNHYQKQNMKKLQDKVQNILIIKINF